MSGEFLDTNVVIYSLSQEERKQNKAIELLSSKPVVSVQVLSESANTMRRKLGFDVVAIRAVVHRISQACCNVQPVTLKKMLSCPNSPLKEIGFEPLPTDIGLIKP